MRARARAAGALLVASWCLSSAAAFLSAPPSGLRRSAPALRPSLPPPLRLMMAAVSEGERRTVPSATQLFVADFLGIRNAVIAKESYAWSHTAHNGESMLLQLTAQIEEEGGKEVASKELLDARRRLFHALIRHDYGAYVRAATVVGGLVDRADLPNVQHVPHPSRQLSDLTPQPVDRALLGGASKDTADVVPDCTLANVTFAENALDKALLFVFRSLVQKQTGYSSSKDGILGLLEEGREYMLRPQQTAEAQNKMVFDTLAGLLTPAMPPIYKTFMSGTHWRAVLGKDFGARACLTHAAHAASACVLHPRTHARTRPCACMCAHARVERTHILIVDAAGFALRRQWRYADAT